MSEKTYLAHTDPVHSYANLSLVDLEHHEHVLKQAVDGHPFNRALTVFLPSIPANKARQYFDHSIGNYDRIEAPLRTLLDPIFFNTYFKSGKYTLMMHSLNTHLNTDDVVVLYPDGKLCLSLVKQTFETFGIEAMKQTKADLKHDKHIVMIDFKKGHFKLDSKEFNRLKWCLENTLTSSFTMACCAIDSLTGAIVDIEWPTSLVKCKERIEIKAEFDTITDVHIPSFEHLAHDMSTQSEGWDGHAMEALEWLGLAHIKASRIKKTEKVPDPFVSVYQPPTPFIQENQMGTFVKFSGLLPAPLMHNIMTIVRKLMTSGVTTHWASITCWGYQDTPLVWQQQTAHYHYYNGENDYTCLLLPNNTCYLYQLLGH